MQGIAVPTPPPPPQTAETAKPTAQTLAQDKAIAHANAAARRATAAALVG